MPHLRSAPHCVPKVHSVYTLVPVDWNPFACVSTLSSEMCVGIHGFSGLRALDQDDVVQTYNSLVHMQELLVTHAPSSFLVSHPDGSDAVSASRTFGHGSDASLVVPMQTLLNSHSDVVQNVLAAGDPTLYKALFTSKE